MLSQLVKLVMVRGSIPAAAKVKKSFNFFSAWFEFLKNISITARKANKKIFWLCKLEISGTADIKQTLN